MKSVIIPSNYERRKQQLTSSRAEFSSHGLPLNQSALKSHKIKLKRHFWDNQPLRSDPRTATLPSMTGTG